MTNDKDYIEMIGIDEDVLFRVLTCDAKGGFYALRPYEIQELQNSIKAIMDDRDHLRAINAKQLEALRIIAGNGCESFLGKDYKPEFGVCIKERPEGRFAEYEADRWCDSCQAVYALEKLSAVIDAANEAD